MKRINPKTGKSFVRGDIRRDGRIFLGYKENIIVKKNGFFEESWIKKESLIQIRLNARNRKAKNRAELKEKNIPKRLNPKTKLPFKKGDFDIKKKKYFYQYEPRKSANGNYQSEAWMDLDTYFTHRIRGSVTKAKERATQRKVKYEINYAYMISIFPKDMICPVLGIKMSWVGERDTTPSIDKIFPNKGYVEGNVVWVSTRANRLKQDATPEEMMKVAKWLKKQEQS
jgi:hypothetical protein